MTSKSGRDPTSGLRRISLWSGPRNVSTALMYSFAQRSDTQVLDEPLYAHYLSHSSAARYHPGSQEVLESMERDGAKVVSETLLGEPGRPVLFFKNMAHHLVELNWDFLLQLENVILTRNPVEMLPSYAQQVSEPTLKDTGYRKQVLLLEFLERREKEVPVLDSRELLLDPRGVLTELCEQLKIPFEEGMLHWEEGPRPEDGIWAKHWYRNVHRSTGFEPYRPKEGPFPERLRPLLEECLPYYQILAERAIQAH